MRHVMAAAAALGFLMLVTPAMAQDAAKVDPAHYKVELDNDQVRVLRVNYGPHEKSVMHSHPASLAIFITDAHVRFTMPDGKTREETVKAGGTHWEAAGTHLPENLGDKPMEVIVVEMKHKPAAAVKK